MASLSRIKRIGEQLKQEIALLIRKEVTHPKAAMISVTLVKVVSDLSQAKVYVTYLGPNDERSQILTALEDAAGELRRVLGKNLRLRTIPKLFFIYDEQLEKSSYLSNLIASAIAQDQEKSQQHMLDDADAAKKLSS